MTKAARTKVSKHCDEKGLTVMNDIYAKHADQFKFGWEVELMITDDGFTPLFGDNLPFERTQQILNMVEVNELSYLKEKYAGSGLRPYYVEGYDAGYENDTVRSVIVKGIEIRTPISFSIEDAVASFENYYAKMQQVMTGEGLHLSCFGNHPFQPPFKGERGQRGLINWASAEVAMTTHGLVINISLPDDLEARLDRERLNNRFSFAAPAMVLFAGNTPFKNGELWNPDGQQGFSERSYRRSFVRDTVYYRDDQNHRKEVTLFDMTNDLSLYAAYAALSLGIILSEEDVPVIPDRFSKENVRQVAKLGYKAGLINRYFEPLRPEAVGDQVLTMSAKALACHGFNEELLNPLWNNLERRELPAQQIVNAYHTGESIQSILKDRSQLIPRG